MADERDRVGIVARADVTAAGRVLDGVRRTAEQGAAALGQVPEHVQAAVRRVAEAERQMAATGAATVEHQEALAEALQVLRTQEALHAAAALEESAQVRSHGLSARIAHLAKLDDQYRRAYGHQYRADELGEVIDRVERLIRAMRPGEAGDGVAPPAAPEAAPPPGAAGAPGAPGGAPSSTAAGGAGATAGAGPGGAPPALPPPAGAAAPGRRGRPLPLPSLYPGSRRLSPGPLPSRKTSWAARMMRRTVRRVVARTRHLLANASRLSNVFTAGYIARAGIRAGDKAGEYEAFLGPFAAQRGKLDGDGAERVDLAGQYAFMPTGWAAPKDPRGVGYLHQVMNFARHHYLGTGDEAIDAMRGLGEHYTPRRMLNSFDAARRVGLPVADHATWYGHWLRFIVDRGGLRQDLGSALAASTMRDRPQELMDDILAYTEAMARGHGLQDSAIPLGFAATMGALGLGGSARRHVGLSLIRGIQGGGDMETVAKIAAIRRFLGPVTIGGGPDARRRDPASYHDAMTILESGDPRVAPAVARWATERAEKMGIRPDLREDTAKTLFASALGMAAADAEAVWNGGRQLQDPGGVGSPGMDDVWHEGPLYKGKDGSTKGSIGQTRAELDFLEHSAGRAVFQLATNIRDALRIAASGFARGGGIVESLDAGLDVLEPEALRLLQIQAVLRGGALGWGTAATLEAKLWKRRLDRVSQGVRNWASGLPGWKRADVQAYAARHGTDEETALLAIMGHSEGAGQSDTEVKTFMHTALNRMAAKPDRDAWATIVGGAPDTGAQNHIRPYATSRVPEGQQLERMLRLRREVDEERARGENYRGATHFLHPVTQDRRYAEGVAKSSAAMVDEAWSKSLERVEVPGTDPDTVWFYRPKQRKPKPKEK